MKQLRVLIFAPSFAPDSFSEALVNSKLALAMLHEGWDVKVISVKNTGPCYESGWQTLWLPLKSCRHDIDVFENQKGRLVSIFNKLYSAIQVKHPVQGAIWAYKAAVLGLKLHYQKPFDFMLTRSTSCMAHLPAIYLKKQINIPWFANWNDPASFLFPKPYSEHASTPKRYLMTRYMRDAIKQADCNTFPSERLLEYLYKPLNIGNNVPTEIIPHISLTQFEPTPYLKEKVFRICHAGNLSWERDPRPFLGALRRLVTTYPNTSIVFNIIGLPNPDLERLVDEFKLGSHVNFCGAMNYINTLQFLGKNDVLLVIEAQCDVGIFLPSKVVDYAQVKRPMLAVSPKIGILNDLVDNYKIGISANNRSIDDIFTALQKLYLQWRDGIDESYCFDQFNKKTSPRNVLLQYEAMFKLIR